MNKVNAPEVRDAAKLSFQGQALNACSIMWLTGLPGYLNRDKEKHEVTDYEKAQIEQLTPAAFKVAEGTPFYKTSYLIAIADEQVLAEEKIKAAGYKLIARCPRGHNAGWVLLYGKGFQIAGEVEEAKKKKIA